MKKFVHCQPVKVTEESEALTGTEGAPLPTPPGQDQDNDDDDWEDEGEEEKEMVQAVECVGISKIADLKSVSGFFLLLFRTDGSLLVALIRR